MRHLPAIVLFVLMAGGSLVTQRMIPDQLLAETLPPIALEQIVPKNFGEWSAVDTENLTVTNPQQQEQLEKIYADTLSRTYQTPDGKIFMLSIAYGRNQSDDTAVHYPEVCYPAQGLQILSRRTGKVALSGRELPVKQLVAERQHVAEPITYWVVVGTEVVADGTAQKLAQIRYGMKGVIPDGMIVRVSSLGADPEAEYELQRRFLEAMVESLSAEMRPRFAGA